MELTDEQQAAIEAVQEQFEPEQLKDAMQENANAHMQPIFKMGYGAHKGDLQSKVSSLEADLEDAQETLEGRASELDELRKNKPDVDKIREEYESKLQKQKDKYTSQVDELQGQIKEKEIGGFSSRVESELKNYVDDFTAEQIANNPNTRDRYDLRDGELVVFDEDGVPMSAGKDNAHKVVAEQLAQRVPDHLRKDTRKQGSKDTGQSYGGSPGTITSKAQLDNAEMKAAYINEHGLEAFESLSSE